MTDAEYVLSHLDGKTRLISNDDLSDLSGKTAIVTVGSGGMGLAAAETLLEHNATQVFLFVV